ncbi:hypothetical protein L6164_014496 [Bauhinia variegata]|uniref:Uncharacterized protein n=1 Tax=Bauhinia variegata TaxID=167791 RepID=A0ACB9NJH4_BAUVA|nr:hypothetical protein L6164_014496 [Bauhinia variegata]
MEQTETERSGASKSVTANNAKTHSVLASLLCSPRGIFERMEVTSEKSNANQKSQSMQANEAPMDFLQRLFSGKPEKAKSSTYSEAVDLSLNLSLGGSYGQNGEQKSLTRSSTIAGDITQRTATNGSLGGYSGVRLEKSSSLPAKAESVLMRFGDLQTMRRAETRRRLLLEKQRRAAAKAAEKEKVPGVPPPPTVDAPHQAAAYAAASAYKSPVLNFAMEKTKSADSNHEGVELSSYFCS